MRLLGGGLDGAVVGGLPGRAASVNVGSTSTGLPGSAASVSNSGSSNAAVLNFTVPRGDVGPQGAPGTPGSVTITGLGDATTISRKVFTSVNAGAGVEDGANTWTKVADISFGTAQYVSGAILLAIGSSSQQVAAFGEYVELSVSATQFDVGGVYPSAASVQILSKSNSNNFAADSFKVISNGYNSAFQLWARKTNAAGQLVAYEIARNGLNMSVTYNTVGAWQSAVPSGIINVSSVGVTADGKPVLPTTATVTTPTRLPNYGNDYTALVNLAASTDAHIGSVDALLHFSGANNSTTILDSSLVASDWNTFGNAKISTAVSAGGTLFLDGAGDYIRATAPASEFAFGTGDFTIEMVVYLSALPTTNTMLYEGRTAGQFSLPTFYINPAGQLKYYVSNGDRILGTTVLSLNTWRHVAVSRVSGTTRIFLNGVQEGSSWTDATSYAAHQPGIGAGGTNFGEFFLTGHVDEVRVTNGVGRYSAGFAVPGAAFPDPAAVTLPTAVGNSTVYTVRNTGSVPVAVNSVGLLDGVKSLTLSPGFSVQAGSNGSNWLTDAHPASDKLVTTTGAQALTNKTISGASNTIINLPASATPDAARYVALTQSTAVPANYWTKIATFASASSAYSRVNLILSFAQVEAITYDNAIISVFTGHNPGGASNIGVDIIARGGASSQIAPDSFKMIANGVGGTSELWVKKALGQGTWRVYELSAAYQPADTITYHTGFNYQAAEPVGSSSNATSNGVTAFGNPVGVRVAVPASNAAPGAVGQWSSSADNAWLYICTAPSTWRRTALTSW